MGDYRLYNSTLQGKELTLAIRNQWPFSDREFLSWTENYLKHHAETFGGDDERSYEVIYNKGPLVCWMLDVEIRVATGNRKYLADLMKILYQRFGNQPKAYSNNDVFAIASELGGQDYDWIYQKYILGTEPIPFENYLAKASVLSE